MPTLARACCRLRFLCSTSAFHRTCCAGGSDCRYLRMALATTIFARCTAGDVAGPLSISRSTCVWAEGARAVACSDRTASCDSSLLTSCGVMQATNSASCTLGSPTPQPLMTPAPAAGLCIGDDSEMGHKLRASVAHAPAQPAACAAAPPQLKAYMPLLICGMDSMFGAL